MRKLLVLAAVAASFAVQSDKRATLELARSAANAPKKLDSFASILSRTSMRSISSETGRMPNSRFLSNVEIS